MSEGPLYCFGFDECLDGLGAVGPERDLRDINIAVTHGDHAHVLFDRRLAAGGELGHRAHGRRL